MSGVVRLEKHVTITLRELMAKVLPADDLRDLYTIYVGGHSLKLEDPVVLRIIRDGEPIE